MLFASTYRIRAEARNAAIERFLRTGGLPPSGVKLVGRWHDLAGRWGVYLAESDDAVLMAKWALEWSDLIDIETRSVVTDEQAGPLLAAVNKQ